MTGPLSVTVFAGSPGTEASLFFDRILKASNEGRVTAIVEKGGRKRTRPRQGVSVVSTKERLVRLGQGCACCTVRGDLRSKIQRISAEQTADHVVIQASPGSDLTTLAKTFTVADGEGASLADVARIEGLVVVVNARSLLATLKGIKARALIERIEFANVIAIVEAKVLTPKVYDRVLCALKALNHEARIVRGDDDGLALSSLSGDAPFSLDSVERRSRRPALVEDEGTSDAIVRFTYSERRPFHPTRLHALLADPWAGVLRVRGSFWVASRADFAVSIDVAGGHRRTSADGRWWATVPEDKRPTSPAFKDYLNGIWDPAFGDRHQELSIVGVDVDEVALRSRLDDCLLTDEELADSDAWAQMAHPFPWPKASA